MKWVTTLFLCFGCLWAAEQKNELILCRHSLETFDWAKQFISHAESSIEWSPCLAGGLLFDEMCLLLSQQLELQPALQVRLFLVPQFLEPSNHQSLKELRRRFPDRFHYLYTTTVISFDKDFVLTDNHVKLLIVDEKYFVTGGSNYDYVIATEGTHTEVRRVKPINIGSFLPNGARDQDVVGSGPLAKELRILFYQLYAIWQDYITKQKLSFHWLHVSPEKTGYFPIQHGVGTVDAFHHHQRVHRIDPAHCHLLLGGPHQSTNMITKIYQEWIDQAKEEIQIANLYFTPRESLRKSMMRAARRGIALTVITNGIHEHSPAYTRLWAYAHRITYCEVLYGTAFSLWQKKLCERAACCPTKIYEYDVDQLVLHKKVMIVDGRRLMLGSYNIGLRSDGCDFELNLAIEDEGLCEEAQEIYAEDLAHSRLISPKQIRDWYFDIWVHYKAQLQKNLHSLI